jgi:rhodanese-related sulfurtransferase
VKFFVDNWILLLVAFVSGAMLVWPMVRRGGAGATSVGTGEAVRLINREKGVLIDVSEPAEFAAGHAAGARHIPLAQLEGKEGKDGKGLHKELPANKAWPLLVMCPNGGRAARAAAALRKAGHERAVAVSGGTNAWREAQLPIERAAGTDKADKAEKGEKADKSDKADKSTSDKAADKAADKATDKAIEKSA